MSRDPAPPLNRSSRRPRRDATVANVTDSLLRSMLAALAAIGCQSAAAPALPEGSGNGLDPVGARGDAMVASSPRQPRSGPSRLDSGENIGAPSPKEHQAAPMAAREIALPAVPNTDQAPEGMSFVPGSTFSMGSDDEGEPDERPAHSVTVGPFWLDTYEVDNAHYSGCVRARVCVAPDSLLSSRLTNGSPATFRRPSHPVVGVSWFDAKAYCEWLGKRLPREAEWERAARGDDHRRYVWGNEPPDPKLHGVFGGRATTEPVGSYAAGRSAFGHFDLAGNVWEWMEDAYDPYAYRRPSAAQGQPGSCAEILQTQDELRRDGKQGFTGKNPIPVECERVLRGGAYNYRGEGLRNSNRVHHPPSWRIAVAGFRCAKDP